MSRPRVSKPGTIYLITQGTYSDYRVVAACLDKKTAESVRKKLIRMGGGPFHSYNDVEAIPLVHGPDEVLVCTTYYVRVDEEGQEIERWQWSERSIGPYRDFTRTEDVKPTPVAPRQAVVGMSTRGYKAALKAARDRLAQLKAEREGVG